MADRRAHLRAALVAVHLLLLTVMAVPRPAVSDKELSKESVQEWFRGTATSLQAIGLPVDTEQVRAAAVPVGRAWLEVRRWLLVPGHWYARVAGTHQGWLMFAGVGPDSARLSIVAVTADGEVPLYLSRSPELAWRRAFFDHERVRTFVNNFVHKRKRERFNRLAQWATDRLEQDMPDARGFRFEMVPTVASEPAVLRTLGALETGEPYWTKTVATAP